MHVETDGTRTYSHTSLSLWRLCKRRWWSRYILGIKEPMSPVAAFSTHLVHAPIAAYYGSGAVSDWSAFEKAFHTEIGDHADRLHTVAAGQRILEAVRKSPPGVPVPGSAERETRIHLSGQKSYTSRADVWMERGTGRHWTVDFKYTERAWQAPGRPWPVRELLPYDDQLLGQAICSEADGFVRGTIRRDPKSGQLADPIIYQEHLVDASLRNEWLAETTATVEEVETWLRWSDGAIGIGPKTSIPKNEDSCFAFGKSCPYLKMCKYGMETKS